ncbi:sigma-70 family RNA polymerase sigma factor [Algoriphagus confluentis]|uniref:Sigma-70 family RNA polymerase sigma factor n=1 Tax=Algoriphagus confluentis TaxID=1697556 RepID=A0ABQ6PJ75_9BACT|nr:hypothetical protein Aconfl_03030 [Algoriphagus confluentis]
MEVKEKQLELLKKGDRETLKQLYLEHKAGFSLFAKRYTQDQFQIDNCYQDAIIALAENAQKGKIETLNSSIGTYLFSIGKFILFKNLKGKNLTGQLSEEMLETIPIETYEEEARDEYLLLLRQKLSELGPKCQEILRLFYFQSKSLEEICKLMGYESKDVLKSSKSRCIKNLKESLIRN